MIFFIVHQETQLCSVRQLMIQVDERLALVGSVASIADEGLLIANRRFILVSTVENGRSVRCFPADQVGLGNSHGGAVEHLGLISYKQASFLFDEEKGNIYDKQDISTLVANKIALQWFANLRP